MPLFRISEINSNVKLGIWKITESLDELLSGFAIHPQEKHSFDKFTSKGRKKQWLATRKLIRILSGRDDLWIKHDSNRKPCIVGGDFEISISHTEGFAAILLGKADALGIDIERIHDRILRIKHKFIREDEFKFLNEDKDDLTQLFLLWSAKETLFKYYEKGNIDFKEHLKVFPFELNKKGCLNTQIHCTDLNQEISLHYEIINGHVLVYTKEFP